MTTSKKIYSKLCTVLIFTLTVSLVNPWLLAQDTQSPPQPEVFKKKLTKYHAEYIETIDPTQVSTTTKGIPQGLSGLAEDALQTIGQIIIDKATTAAFDLLKKRVQRFLKCSGTGCSDDQWCFPATCKVIDNIRFEEIVQSRKVLYQALTQDIFFNVSKKIEKLSSKLPPDKKDVVIFLKGIMMDILLEKLSDINKPMDNISVSMITERFFDFFITKLKDPDKVDKEVLHAAIAALTVWKARKELAEKDFIKASMKLFLDKILVELGNSESRLPKIRIKVEDNISVKDTMEYFRILKTADLLHEAISLVMSSMQKGENVVKSWNNLVDILFETAYYIVDDTGTEYEKARYDTLQNGVNLQKATDILFIAKDIIDGAINKDINTIINSVSMVLRAYEKKYEDDLKKLSEDKQTEIKKITGLKKKVNLERKAIQMIGVVLLYAQTYTDKSLDEKTAQAKRTQLISSLVTERKERDRGGVISFGGSLRGILSSKKKAIDVTTGESKSTYGPFSVPIGFGLDWYWGKSVGLHLEFDIVDLGHFTSFDGGSGVVEKPRLSDVFAPSATAGIFVGLGGYPLYLGLTYGYSPKYYIPENGSVKKGSLNLGFTLGIYIPLIDFN